jgi:AcrR family transcriptional regulator
MGQENGNAEKILKVGIHLMAGKGYQGTSTREIVEAAGVTKPMLYYYYDSKEGLCKAGLRRFSDRFFAKLREQIDAPLEPRESLVEYVWTIFHFMQENRDEGLFYMSLFFGPERQWFMEEVTAIITEGRELSNIFIAKLIEAGVLKEGCEEDFCRTLHGMIDIWRWDSIREEFLLSREIAKRIVDSLLEGYGVRQTTGVGL